MKLRHALCLVQHGGHKYYPPFTRNWRERRVCKFCAYVRVREVK